MLAGRLQVVYTSLNNAVTIGGQSHDQLEQVHVKEHQKKPLQSLGYIIKCYQYNIL